MRRTVLFALFLLAVHPLSAAETPNVVMIISDDQAWNDYGFMGHDAIHTPALDKLAGQSAVFPRGYVPSSLCRPSLMSMITGLYPHQHGVTGNDPPKGMPRESMLKHVRNHPTLPKLLAEKGYRSMQSGKWWEGNFKEGGFTQGMSHGDPKHGGRHGDEGLKIGRNGLQPVLDFIDSCGDKPFLLWYAPMLPHSPHNPPKRLLEKYQAPGRPDSMAKYYAMCEWWDETCGELLDYLDKKGLSDNTLVVYVCDNGWIQDPKSPRYAPKSKRSPYDGGIRTPIMVRWPGKVKPKHYDDFADSIDLAPTILAACGLKPTAEMQGLNLLDVCAGKAPKRNILYGEIFEHDVADVDRPAASLLYRWCIEGNQKLILPHGKGKPELYDLAADPWETKNLAADHPDAVKHLTEKLNAWWSPN